MKTNRLLLASGLLASFTALLHTVAGTVARPTYADRRPFTRSALPGRRLSFDQGRRFGGARFIHCGL